MSEPFTRYASVRALSYVNTNSTMADSVTLDGVLSVPRQEIPIETIRYVGIAFLGLHSYSWSGCTGSEPLAMGELSGLLKTHNAVE